MRVMYSTPSSPIHHIVDDDRRTLCGRDANGWTTVTGVDVAVLVARAWCCKRCKSAYEHKQKEPLVTDTVLAYEIEVRGSFFDEDAEQFKDTRRTFKRISATCSRLAMQSAIDEFIKAMGNTPREPVIHNVKLIGISI